MSSSATNKVLREFRKLLIQEKEVAAQESLVRFLTARLTPEEFVDYATTSADILERSER